MKLIVTKHNLGLWAAAHIQSRWAARNKNPFVLGLPTGGTVVDMYAALRSLAQHGKISFKDIVTFNMDEYVGLPKEHAQSYHSYMHQNLFNHVDVLPQNVHILNGQASDLHAECVTYENSIAQAGGIDLFLGGVGQNGHVAFNEPGSAFDSHTRIVDLTPSTITANARFFEGKPEQVPTQALTVGIGTVLAAKELLFLANGKAKAEAVAQLAHTEITPQWPITALKTHPNAILIADPDAASELPAIHKERLQTVWAQNPDADIILEL